MSSITHSRLDCVPEYSAVSYSWVGNSDQDSLMCDGHNLSMQRTVYQLLGRLRSLVRTVTLWIDAICINQDDLAERSSQVGVMEKIYSSARSVIIWIGEEDERTAEVAELLKLLGQRLDTVGGGTFTFAEGSSQDIQAPKVPWRLAPDWDHLRLFLDRPWFTRTWVLQEVALAQECSLRCGSYVWQWQRLLTIFEFLTGTTALEPTGVGRRLRQGVIEFSHHWKQDENRIASIFGLLVASQGTSVSRPVDKVYAVLPLATHRLGIKIDYRRYVKDVYFDVAARVVSTDGLEILLYACDGVWNNVRGLPSWVPDWTCNDKPAILVNVALQQAIDGILESIDTRGLSVMPQVNANGKFLTIDVVDLGSIGRSGVPWPGDRSEVVAGLDGNLDGVSLTLCRLDDWRSMLWHWKQNSARQYMPTGESSTGAFARTIVADTVRRPSRYGAWEEVYAGLKKRLRRMLRTGPKSFWSDYIHGLDDLDEYHEAVKALCYKRTFFLTANGYMGIGPFFALPSDHIFLVPGLKSLLVMRRSLRGKYRLLGEAYVHGLGRQNMSSPSRLKLEQIVLE